MLRPVLVVGRNLFQEQLRFRLLVDDTFCTPPF